jgi:anti-sigma B factor antagonist
MVQLTPVDTVRELWARFERDGVEAALGLVDEDVVYLLQLGGGRVLRGSEEVRALFADFERRGVSLEARLDTLEQRGGAVVASGSVRIHQPDDGLQEGQYHWIFHFADGRLRRLSVYAGRDEALASLAALNAIAPPPTEFEVEVEVGEERGVGGIVTIRPTGELDIATAARLEAALVADRKPGDRVVLDLAALEFVDSTGLRAIVRGAEAARRDGWELRLRPGPPPVQRVFEIAGVLGALPFDAP